MKRLMMLGAMSAMLALVGCVKGSDLMTRSDAPAVRVDGSKATVVFLRPSNYGGAIQASVYDATKPTSDFIGIVSGNTRVAYQAEPGKHLFMVVGENADFVNATLDAGKTYYVLVSPRMGMWKARFSLLPIHSDASAKYSLKSADFAKWQAGTHLVQKSPSADAWYSANATSIAAKRADYMKRWNTASAEQQAELTILPSDGI